MIPSDIRLYSWVDVENLFLLKQAEKVWPEWLLSVRAYFDALRLSVKSGHCESARKWLAENFEPRFLAEEGKDRIVLEYLDDHHRRDLPVFLEETEERESHEQTWGLIPTLSRPQAIFRLPENPPAVDVPVNLPPVAAFHSYKGGVGRTLHALAFALSITGGGGSESRVLMVDGDLEAPGLSWMLRKRITSPSISFADLLTLVHGDPDPNYEMSIDLAAKHIKNMLLNGVYILPAFRSPMKPTLEIKPEHLVKYSRDPFIMRNMLAKLAKKLGASLVIVDLRAGVTEVSSGLLLDPMVYRVLVTTLSAQSIQGTESVLELIAGRTIAKNDQAPFPAMLITQIPNDVSSVESKISKLWDSISKFNQGNQSEETEDPPFLKSLFDSTLMVLPQDWDDIVAVINRSKLPECVRGLRDWLPEISSPAGENARMKEPAGDVKSIRQKMMGFTSRLIYAEKNMIREFLSINPLRNLATDFSYRIPIAVISGSKGAGKTFTYLQILLRKNWKDFVQDAGDSQLSGELGALIIPVLWSKNLSEGNKNIFLEQEQGIREGLQLGEVAVNSDIKDYIQDCLKGEKEFTEGEWRDKWLDIIAWKCGLMNKQAGAGRKLNELLFKNGKNIVGIIDGLEDLFQDLLNNDRQKTALRSLLQEVPDWLANQQYDNVGVLVFVRQDMVYSAIKQNSGQFLDKYSPYHLKWNFTEALRLAAWIANKFGFLELSAGSNLQKMEKPEISEYLVRLWGRKMGKDNSNEGRTSEWVISALADLKGQIQARDIVRLLHKSLEYSLNDSSWPERILPPNAIRKSLTDCSVEKIKEIEQENPALNSILKKLKERNGDDRLKIPFTSDESHLKFDELSFLEDNGVLLREGDMYYMPEIFRNGLGISLRGGARPRVIYLQRRVMR